MAFKMKRSSFMKTGPTGATTVGFDDDKRKFDEEGSEWYMKNNAQSVDYDALSPDQKSKLEQFRQGREDTFESSVYSANGNLYFDQGEFHSNEAKHDEPMLVQTEFNKEHSSESKPTIAPDNELMQSDFGARTFSVRRSNGKVAPNQQTFSNNNPYTKDIKGEYMKQESLNDARRWERLNGTMQTRNANNRFGNNS